MIDGLLNRQPIQNGCFNYIPPNFNVKNLSGLTIFIQNVYSLNLSTYKNYGTICNFQRKLNAIILSVKANIVMLCNIRSKNKSNIIKILNWRNSRKDRFKYIVYARNWIIDILILVISMN